MMPELFKESQFYKATNRHFEEIKKQVQLWLEPLAEALFEERSRQKVLDSMKGLEPEIKLIALLPTENLRKKFHETIENYLKAKLKEKILSKEEMYHLIVRKLLELTNPNSEYDILFFQKVDKKYCKGMCLMDYSFRKHQLFIILSLKP